MGSVVIFFARVSVRNKCVNVTGVCRNGLNDLNEKMYEIWEAETVISHYWTQSLGPQGVGALVI